MPWTPEADRAFSRLKMLITEAPVLAYPQFDKDFVLEIDASLKGVGACLGQFDSDGVLHPVAFASRALHGAECRYPDYSSFKLELLGLKWAVADKFGELLMGHQCLVLTDNNPLAHLKTAKLSATEQRWVAKLDPYDLKIRYRSGKSNCVADALSRYPFYGGGNPDKQVDVLALVNQFTCSSTIPVEVSEVVTQPSGTPGDLASGIIPTFSKEELAKMQREDECLGILWKCKVTGWEIGHEEPGVGDSTPRLKGWLREYDRYSFHKGLCIG